MMVYCCAVTIGVRAGSQSNWKKFGVTATSSHQVFQNENQSETFSFAKRYADSVLIFL